jgi:hypothetical protein
MGLKSVLESGAGVIPPSGCSLGSDVTRLIRRLGPSSSQLLSGNKAQQTIAMDALVS